MIQNVFSRCLLFAALGISLASCEALKPLPATPVADEVSTLGTEIADYARQHVGTRYKYAGKSPKGFDCSGFTYYVFGQHDLPLPASSATQEKAGKAIRVEDARPGDLVFFRRTKNGEVFHVALVLDHSSDGLTVIHSTTSRGVVIDRIWESSYWREMHATARRVVE